MKFNDILIRIRRDAGWFVSEFALLMEMDESAIRAIESGAKCPSTETINRWFKIASVGPNDAEGLSEDVGDDPGDEALREICSRLTDVQKRLVAMCAMRYRDARFSAETVLYEALDMMWSHTWGGTYRAQVYRLAVQLLAGTETKP